MARRHDGRPRDARFPVVGIGASAGGITALEALFTAIPSRANLAFIVLQHLPADHRSKLPALLRTWTTMPIRRAAHRVIPKPNCVYVVPAGHILTMHRGAFSVRPIGRSGPRAGIDTIDTLFEGLARAFGPRSIAVVLSGSGADGAAGAIQIKQANGMVFVQDPSTALHDAMPRAAVANGAADHILPLGALAQELAACASPSYVRPASPIRWTDAVGTSLDAIVALIRKDAGFDLRGYKTTPLLWRIQRRMEARRVQLFQDYEALLRDDPAELQSLVRGIPIHVTEFFRDPDAWEALAELVIAPLFHEHGSREPLRTWTPACSTGEEAYSLAMLLTEQAAGWPTPVGFQAFASDVLPEVVARASRGVFSGRSLTGVGAERLERFFYAADGAYRVKRSLREKMVFAAQNLLSDPPFTRMHLITCRNLLIYLEPDAAQQVILLLHASLLIGGYLFLGKSESLLPQQPGFETISTTCGIYRKVAGEAGVSMTLPRSRLRLEDASAQRFALDASAHHAALEELDLPSLLVDGDFNILRVVRDVHPFLRFPIGEPSLNLLQLGPRGFGPSLRAAAERALAEERGLTVDHLPDPETNELSMSVRVTPLHADAEASSARLLVSFIRGERTMGPSRPGRRKATRPGEAPPRARKSDDREDALRLSHEELDSSRAELQALNEELKTANEQLNVSDDDLNATNRQLQSTIAELATQSSVLSSGAVMTLFLDEELRVRWFTPAVSELFRLLPGDTGRRITDLRPRFLDPMFADDIHEVMRSGQPSDAEIHNASDRWFLRRIRPFESRSGAGGVAVTFTDITDRKHSEEALQASENRMRGQKEAFMATLNGAALKESLGILARIVIAETNGQVRTAFYAANPEGTALYAIRGAGTMPESYLQQVDGFAIGKDSVACGLAIPTGHPILTRDVLDEPLWRPWVRLAAQYDFRGCWSFPIKTRERAPIGTFALYFREPREAMPPDLALADLVTQAAAIIMSNHTETRERARAEEALRHSEERFRKLIEVHAQAAWETTAAGEVVSDSLSWRASTGQTVEEWVGHGWVNAVHPDDREQAERQWRDAIAAQEDMDAELRLRCAAGGWRWTNVRATPIRAADGAVVKWVGMNVDIDDRKRREGALQARNDELERVDRVTVGSERRITELKTEVDALRTRLGERARYAPEPEGAGDA